jgi:propanediol utilization protein
MLLPHSVERLPVVILERHVHLRQDIIEQLFCSKYHLHELAQFSQTPDFLSEEFVTLVGPHGRIPHVRVYGPPRPDNQVEISQADAVTLGVHAPLRESGDLKDTPGILIEGPRVCVRLDHGVIRVLRHVHLDPAEAERCGLADHARMDVSTPGTEARTLFCDVLVRVAGGYRPELHLDADEARSAGLHAGSFVAIRKRV